MTQCVLRPLDMSTMPCILVVGGLEMIRLEANGDIYVKSKLIENDKELVDGLREWLFGVKGNSYVD